jgi:sulfur relay protein TusC/DsrF
MLALLVTQPPHAQRESRAELDVALAAAAMDCTLEIFFIDEGLLQLAEERNPAAALMPPGLKGWGALPDLADVRVFAERENLSRCRALGIDLILPVEALAASEFRRRWRSARHAMVL